MQDRRQRRPLVQGGAVFGEATRHERGAAIHLRPVHIERVAILRDRAVSRARDDDRVERIQRLDEPVVALQPHRRDILVRQVRLVVQIPRQQPRMPHQRPHALGHELLVAFHQLPAANPDERLQPVLLRLIQVLDGRFIGARPVPRVVVHEVESGLGDLRHILDPHTVHAKQEALLAPCLLRG